MLNLKWKLEIIECLLFTLIRRQKEFHIILCFSCVLDPFRRDSIRWAIKLFVVYLILCSHEWDVDDSMAVAVMMVYRCKCDTEILYFRSNPSICQHLRIDFLSRCALLCKTWHSNITLIRIRLNECSEWHTLLCGAFIYWFENCISLRFNSRKLKILLVFF